MYNIKLPVNLAIILVSNNTLQHQITSNESRKRLVFGNVFPNVSPY